VPPRQAVYSPISLKYRLPLAPGFSGAAASWDRSKSGDCDHLTYYRPALPYGCAMVHGKLAAADSDRDGKDSTETSSCKPPGRNGKGRYLPRAFTRSVAPLPSPLINQLQFATELVLYEKSGRRASATDLRGSASLANISRHQVGPGSPQCTHALELDKSWQISSASSSSGGMATVWRPFRRLRRCALAGSAAKLCVCTASI